jgi:hypothetical protein
MAGYQTRRSEIRDVNCTSGQIRVLDEGLQTARRSGSVDFCERIGASSGGSG